MRGSPSSLSVFSALSPCATAPHKAPRMSACACRSRWWNSSSVGRSLSETLARWTKKARWARSPRPHHVLDRGEQERRAGDEQALIEIAEQLAPGLARAFADDAKAIGQPIGEVRQIVVADDVRVDGGDKNFVRVLRPCPGRRHVGGQ